MKERVAYDDAVDLLDADHKAVKKMFMDHAALCEDGSPLLGKRMLAQRICHVQAKEAIARIEALQTINPGLDTAVKQLGVLIDQHVLEEQEQIFLRSRLAALDLRAMTLPLLKRQQQLKTKVRAAAVKEAA